jgi:predicted amidohydrolase
VSIPHRYRAGFVQFDIKRDRVEANLAMVETQLAALARAKVKLAVLPEMWTSSSVPGELERIAAESAGAVQELRGFARRHGMVVVGSSWERVGRHVYNTAQVIDADGEIVGAYRKIHLFTPGGERLTFKEGKTPLIVQTAVGLVGVTICYDLRFPELYRALAGAGARLIVAPAQWPAARVAHWRTLLSARAIENQVYVLGCNRTGVEKKTEGTLKFPGASALIDPWGETLATKGASAGCAWGEIDDAVIDTVRKRIPVWNDRRPGAYKLRKR